MTQAAVRCAVREHSPAFYNELFRAALVCDDEAETASLEAVCALAVAQINPRQSVCVCVSCKKNGIVLSLFQNNRFPTRRKRERERETRPVWSVFSL